ncbi:MAG: response regulator [Anaerolineales bacterium]|jgi:CheY-like chemotaxis protein/REP element-mobilizing transposase RayT
MIPIVVIDSSPDFADLIRQVLGESGQYDILAAHTANEGLDIIQEGYVRLAIVDFDLPDVNGADLVVEMRTVYPSLAVIAIPLSNTVDSPELEGLPIEGVLTKPFFPPHLPKIIHEALAQVGYEPDLDETAELVDPSEIVTARFDEDALIDEIQDLFEDQDFAPTQYPSQYDFEAEAAQTGDLGTEPEAAQPSTPFISGEDEEPTFEPDQPEPKPRRIDPSAIDTQEHEVVRFERPSPFADGEGWVDMGQAAVDPSAETSELKREVPSAEAEDEWYTVAEAEDEDEGADLEVLQPEEPQLEEQQPEELVQEVPLEEPSLEPQAGLTPEPEAELKPEIPDSLRMGTREFASRLDVLRQSAPDAKASEDETWDEEPEEAVEEAAESFPQDAPSFEDLVASIRDEDSEEISVPESSPLGEEGMTWVEMMAQQSESKAEPEPESEGESWFDTPMDDIVAEEFAEEKPAPAVEWSFGYEAEPVGQEETAPAHEPARGQTPQVDTDMVEPPPPWLEDVDRAAQYLTRLSLETSAVAALLTRGSDVWAYAGELTQAQVQALTSLIAEFWNTEDPTRAIARFISLPESDSDFMFYGTHVAGGIVLSLVFSAETPFGMIRRQAQSLAHTLSEIDPSDHVSMPVPESEEEDEESLPEFDFESEGFKLTQDPGVFFSDLDFPPPDPEQEAEGEAELEELEQAPEMKEPEPEPRLEEPEPEPIPSDWVPDREQRVDHLDFLEQPAAEPTVEETLPTPAAKAAGGPLPKSEVDMSFSLVLVPRFPEHRLTGSLAEELHRWVERLCLAWDWRADRIDIEPAYVAVTLTIPPEAAPASVVSQLRDDLSQRVLDNFPELARDLPSGRFWARGFLLKAGDRPKDEHIQAFILQTRRAQGLAS